MGKFMNLKIFRIDMKERRIYVRVDKEPKSYDTDESLPVYYVTIGHDRVIAVGIEDKGAEMNTDIINRLLFSESQMFTSFFKEYCIIVNRYQDIFDQTEIK